MLEAYLLEVLGEKSLAIWLASFTFIVVGVIVSLRLSAYKRDVESNNTPYKFNWGFLFRDNFSRFIGSIFVAFSVLRFGEELVGISIGYFGSFLLGLCFDQIYKLLIDWQSKARDVFKAKE
jgi:hypothetical protein